MKYNYIQVYFILIIALLLYVFCNAGSLSANLEQKNFPSLLYSNLRKIADSCTFLETCQSYKLFFSRFDKEITTEEEPIQAQKLENPLQNQQQADFQNQQQESLADAHTQEQEKEENILPQENKRESPPQESIATTNNEETPSIFPPAAEDTASQYAQLFQQIKTPYKILLVGDSFMEDMYLSILRNKIFQYDKKIKYFSIAKFSTGLATGKIFNWFTVLRQNVEKYQPDIVMINIGVNDINPISYLHEKKIPFSSQEWSTRYREIVEEFIDIVLLHKAKVIWVGLPVMGEKFKARWIPLVEKLQREGCAHKGIVYIDTTQLLADKEGKYQAYMQMPDGEQKRIRQKDDYHIAPEGEKLVLNKIFPVLLETIHEIELEREKLKSSAKEQ